MASKLWYTLEVSEKSPNGQQTAYMQTMWRSRCSPPVDIAYSRHVPGFIVGLSEFKSHARHIEHGVEGCIIHCLSDSLPWCLRPYASLEQSKDCQHVNLLNRLTQMLQKWSRWIFDDIRLRRHLCAGDPKRRLYKMQLISTAEVTGNERHK